jgi:adenosylcobinamide-GDP ribazoletransferase
MLKSNLPLLASLLGATIFYTAIPLPKSWQVSLGRVAHWSPAIGLLLGGLLALADEALHYLGWPLLTRSAAVVACWVAVTGGLHLDGAIDTADGLAVADAKRRLAVMADSRVGAFGVVAAALLLLLKTAALSDLSAGRWLALMAAAGWGRWGQVAAIAFYPYLKPTGKGAFHKQALRLPQDLVWGFLLLLFWSGMPVFFNPSHWQLGLAIALTGAVIALLVGFWFYRRLGGQTGDTYGAVVEWTEALILCCLSGWLNLDQTTLL